MLRTIIASLIALAVLLFAYRSCDVSPQQVEERILLAGLNAEEGAAFRTANRVRAGVVELPGGLQVEVLEEGSGSLPQESDWVVVHYRGQHVDGRVFDDSWRRGEPVTLPLAQTIEGWKRALPSLPVGSRILLVVPPELAYGGGRGVIGPDETLIFEIALLAIAQAPATPERDPSQAPVPGLR